VCLWVLVFLVLFIHVFYEEDLYTGSGRGLIDNLNIVPDELFCHPYLVLNHHFSYWVNFEFASGLV